MKKKIYFLMYDQCIVHGGFFDNFEYYYVVKKVFKDCDVKWRCITNHPREEVLAMLNDKYHDIDPKVYKDIEVVKHKVNTFWKNPLMIDVLICPTNSAIYWFLQNGNFQAAKWYIGLSDWKDIHPKQNKVYPNHYVLGDERIYGYNPDVCNFIPYRKKILFDKFIYREPLTGKYDYMLNLSLLERRFPMDWIIDLLIHFGYGKGIKFCAYTGHKNEKYYSYFNDWNDIDLIIPPVDNFMGLFDDFIYIPYKDGTDATPRLIPECKFFRKGIQYYDKDISIKSGGYYRYQDTINNFGGLWLKEDDEIMEYIDKCLSS